MGDAPIVRPHLTNRQVRSRGMVEGTVASDTT